MAKRKTFGRKERRVLEGNESFEENKKKECLWEGIGGCSSKKEKEKAERAFRKGREEDGRNED